MGFLNSRLIGLVLGGLALAGLLWSWYSRGQQIETLEVSLTLCHSQRNQLEASQADLQKALAEQNAAIKSLEKKAKERQERLASAQQEAERNRELADQKINDIMSLVPPESEIEQCREARRLLVRD